MSNTTEYPEVPWIRMSEYKSKDKNNPDNLHIKVDSIEPFETDYGISIRVLLLLDGQYVPRNLTLKSENSSNTKLQKLWDKNVKNGRIRKDIIFTLRTFKRKSKKSDYEVRDYWIQF